jgi:hypothetical protein
MARIPALISTAGSISQHHCQCCNASDETSYGSSAKFQTITRLCDHVLDIHFITGFQDGFNFWTKYALGSSKSFALLLPCRLVYLVCLKRRRERATFTNEDYSPRTYQNCDILQIRPHHVSAYWTGSAGYIQMLDPNEAAHPITRALGPWLALSDQFPKDTASPRMRAKTNTSEWTPSTCK